MGKQEEIIFDGKKYICEDLIITCSPTERAFLDEIRERFGISNQTLLSRQPMADGEYVTLYQSDFKCNLQELVEKKDDHT